VTENGPYDFARALIAQLPYLRRYAIALIGNVSGADDLVQDCVERALRHAATLEEPQRLAAWMRSILHNIHLDALRRQRSRGVAVDLTELENDLALSVQPEDRASIADYVRAMNSLSFEHRQVLLLVSVEGLNYREIAAELGVPIGTVMSRLARARERLRSALEQGVPSASAKGRDDRG
jgi:RNA polymerase sigma factor (sigma-70 family)